MYLQYFNHYKSIERFAVDYDVPVDIAEQIVFLGRLVNNAEAITNDN